MAEPWEGVVKIPEGKVGTYAIEHFTSPAGEVPCSDLRTKYCGGQADPPLHFDRETTWHRLTYEGGTWMTDLPIEQVQHDKAFAPILEHGGAVLIGGLGLGYAVNVIAACDLVERVVVVELAPEVVELVGPHIIDPRGVVEIVNMDLFGYLKKLADTDEFFDFAFYDIWQSDGEATFHNTVVPLRTLSDGFVDTVICWNENVMRGQLFRQLCMHRLGGESLDARCQPRDKYHDWAIPFWVALRDDLHDAQSDDDRCLKLAGAYAMSYGYLGWEDWWATTIKRGGEV
jgi:hypothetical protein